MADVAANSKSEVATDGAFGVHTYPPFPLYLPLMGSRVHQKDYLMTVDPKVTCPSCDCGWIGQH